MIYGLPDASSPIDQGDLIDDCYILSIKAFNLQASDLPGINIANSRVLILTQACDLANCKTPDATVAVVHDAQFIVDQGLLKRADVRGPVRAARVYGWYFLPSDPSLALNEMIVDLHQLHTVGLDLLTALTQMGRRRAWLLSRYREHLAKHFADTFSRIALPGPYQTDP
jgi:hypothetical protein